MFDRKTFLKKNRITFTLKMNVFISLLKENKHLATYNLIPGPAGHHIQWMTRDYNNNKIKNIRDDTFITEMCENQIWKCKFWWTENRIEHLEYIIYFYGKILFDVWKFMNCDWSVRIHTDSIQLIAMVDKQENRRFYLKASST